MDVLAWVLAVFPTRLQPWIGADLGKPGLHTEMQFPNALSAVLETEGKKKKKRGGGNWAT